MSVPVLVQPRAEADLREIVAWWTSNRSPEQALRWWDEILKAIETLRKHPGRCPSARENSEHDHDLHVLNFGLGPKLTHRILFAISPDAVHILTVRHLAQDDIGPGDLP